MEVQQKGATVNSDFIASGSTRSFADKDNSSQSFIVSIKGDDIPEPDEEIVIKLVNPTGGVRVATGMYCKAKQCYTEECISALFLQSEEMKYKGMRWCYVFQSYAMSKKKGMHYGVV